MASKTHFEVRPGFALLWPEYTVTRAKDGTPRPFVDRRHRVWATAGQVVDLSDDFLRSLTHGQEHKLTPAKGARAGARVVDPKGYPVAVSRALALRAHVEETGGAAPKEAAPVIREARKVAEKVGSDLPGIETDTDTKREL